MIGDPNDPDNTLLSALFPNNNPPQPPPRPPAMVPQAGTVRVDESGAHNYARGGVSVQPWLVDTVRQASRVLPQGYHAKIISTVDPRATGTVWHPSGRAIDIQIYDENGNKVPNLGGRERPGYDVYSNMAAAAKSYQQQNYPDQTFVWGGHFHSGTPFDRMHFQSTGISAEHFTPQQLAQAQQAMKAGGGMPVSTAAVAPDTAPRTLAGYKGTAPPVTPVSYAPTTETAPAQTAIKGAMRNPTGAVPQASTTGAAPPSSAAPKTAAAAPGASPAVPLPQPRPPAANAPLRAPIGFPGSRDDVPIDAVQKGSLGQQIVQAMGPRGAGMSTYVDPNTRHQILSPGGSGETAMGLTRDLGPVSYPAAARAVQQSIRPAAPAPQRPAVNQPPGGTAASPAAPVNFSGVRTPRSDFSGPTAPLPFSGMVNPSGLLKPPTMAPDEAGLLAPPSQNDQPSQTSQWQPPGLSPFNVGGVNVLPAQPPAKPFDQATAITPPPTQPQMGPTAAAGGLSPFATLVQPGMAPGVPWLPFDQQQRPDWLNIGAFNFGGPSAEGFASND